MVSEDLATEDEVNMFKVNRQNRTALRKLTVAIPMVVLLLLLSGLQLQANTIYWIGKASGAGSTSWGTAANWCSAVTGTCGGTGPLPTSVSNVVWDTAHNPFSHGTYQSDVAETFNTLTLATTTANTKIGSAVTISSSLPATVATGATGSVIMNANTINGALLVNGGGTLYYKANGQSGAIGPSGSITTTIGVATIAGTWTNSSTAQITNTVASPGTLTLGDGGTTTTKITGGILTGAINVNQATLSAMTNSGTGTLTITGASVWSGGTNSGTIATNGGTLTIQNEVVNGNGTTISGTIKGANGTNSLVTIATGGQVDFGNVVGIVTNNGTLSGTTIGDGGTTPTTVTGGTLSGNTFTKAGNVTNALNTGVLTNSSGNSTWSGGTNNGTLTTVGGGGTLTVTGNVTNTTGTITGVTLTGVALTGGTLSGNDFATGSGTLSDTLSNLINAGTTTVSGTTTLIGTISDTGTFSVISGGSLDLSSVAVTGGGSIVTSGTGSVSSDGTVLLTVSDPGGFNLTVDSGSTISSTTGWDFTSGNTTEVKGGGTLKATGGSIINAGGTLADRCQRLSQFARVRLSAEFRDPEPQWHAECQRGQPVERNGQRNWRLRLRHHREQRDCQRQWSSSECGRQRHPRFGGLEHRPVSPDSRWKH